MTLVVVAAALALFLGAALQSSTGFGFALVSAPILFALIGPREAVTTGVIVGILLNGATLATERRRPQILMPDAALLLAWSVPGLAVGVVALREVPERALTVLVALAVFAGLAQRVRIRRKAVGTQPRPWHLPAAGVTAGALATSTSLSGPPLIFALLPRAKVPAQMRDSLAAIFVAQSLITLPVLLATGTYAAPPAVAVLLLAGLVGQLVGRRVFGWLQGDRYERAVLAALAATALVALVASIT